MKISTRHQVTQWLGRIAAVGAVELLTGTMTPTAEARPRQAANGDINMCFEAGGDPFFFDFAGVWAVGCNLGSTWWVVDSNGNNTGGTYGENVASPVHANMQASSVTDQGRHRTHKHHKHRPHTCKRC